MKTSNMMTILGVSSALALSAAFAPMSRADGSAPVSPDESTPRTEATASGVTGRSNGLKTGRAPATLGGSQTLGSSLIVSGGTPLGPLVNANYWGGGVYPGSGYAPYPPYYPPIPYYPPGYYQPQPYIAPIAPEPFGQPAWISSFPLGTGYYYPYSNYYYPPPYAYPQYPQYPAAGRCYHPGYSCGSGTTGCRLSSRTTYGGVSIGSGGVRVTIGGSRQTTTSTTTTTTFP